MTWWSDCSLIDREQGALLEWKVTVWQGDTCVGCGNIAKWYSIWAIVSIWMSCWPGVLAKNGKYEGRRSTADWFCGYEIITIFPIIVIWLGIKSVECHHHIYPRVNKRQNHLGIRWWNRNPYEISELPTDPMKRMGWSFTWIGLPSVSRSSIASIALSRSSVIESDWIVNEVYRSMTSRSMIFSLAKDN